LQVTIRQIPAKNKFKKIRNAETGKSAREKCEQYKLFQVPERRIRIRAV
jgi:hypothetical protein